MFSKAFTIARLYLSVTFRDRSTFIFAFLMPLLFTLVIGQAIGGGGDPADRWTIAVVNEDEGALGDYLVADLAAGALAVREMDAAAALAAVDADEVTAALVLPAGFSAAAQSGAPMSLDFHVSSDGVAESPLVQQAVQASLARLGGSLRAAATAATVAGAVGYDDTALTDTALAAAVARWDEAPLTVQAEPVTALAAERRQVPNGVGQSSPGMLVLFAMIFMLGGTAVLVQERRDGTLRRLVVMPMHRATIIVGKLLGVYTSGVIQIAVLILAGALFFGVSWGQSPAALLVMVLSFAFATTSLGMLLAALARSLAQANALPTLVVMPLAALGGAMWPLEIAPGWMQQLGHFFPTAWAMDGFNDIITRGLGLEAILPEASVLVAYGVVFLAVGVWRFRYE